MAIHYIYSMKSQIILVLYGIFLCIIVGLGIKYIQNKGSDIDDFCNELSPLTGLIDVGSSIQILNELEQELTYKAIFCLSQSTVVDNEGDYLIQITSDSIRQELSIYSNLSSITIASSFAHLYKRNR